MAQEVASFNPKFCSVIQVDKDISFVVDNRDIDFALSVPTEKRISNVSRRTYSKKQPVDYNTPINLLENKVNGNANGTSKTRKSILKNSPKCTSPSPQKTKGISRKRSLDSESSKTPRPRKMRKKDTSSTKVPPPIRINGRITGKSIKHSQSINGPSLEPDIEILNVIESGTSRTIKKEPASCNGKERSKEKLNDIHRKRNSKSLSSMMKMCYPSSDDVPITEADIAPVIPSNSVIPDTSVSETNQNIMKLSGHRWILPDAVSDVPPVQIVEVHGAKESYSIHTENHKESDDKVTPMRRGNAARELKNLYANLNEIYWSKEKKFKQMISTDHRHSERITAKTVDEEKNLRRLKAGSGKPLFPSKRRNALSKKNSPKLAIKKTQIGKLKPKLELQKTVKAKPTINRINKANKKVIRKPFIKPNKRLKADAKVKKQPKAIVKQQPKATFKQQPKAIVKQQPKATVKQQPKAIVKQQPKAIVKQQPKAIVKQQPKAIVKQQVAVELKPKCEVASSSKSPKIKDNSSKSKIVNRSQNVRKSVLPNSALETAVKCENEHDTQVIPKGSSTKIIKKIEYRTKEVKILGKNLSDSKVYSTALRKGSKLRVHVEPLEHTNLWNADFCEAFSKYVIEQSSSQMETKNKDAIKAMFQELMESWYNNSHENTKLLKKKKPEEESLRSSVRQSEGAFRYKEIVVKKHENYMQFILVPNAVKQNSLSIEAMKELRDAFLLAKKDPNCRAVLLNSSGTFFCTGIDLSLLVGNNKKQVAEEMASTIKELVLTLSSFTKPVIAAVNGTAVGFGVTLLTLCDVVLASDKATFCIPATRLGYLPEGAITLTLPQVVGSTVATELLLYGRRLTADQALRHGLVSEVLWHSNLMNEVVPRVQIICSQPLQVMEATKTMVRCHLWDRLKLHMEQEWRLLPPLWLDAQCQSNIKKALQTGWLID